MIKMVRLPLGCTLDRSELKTENNRIVRIFYDEEGNEIHRIWGTKIRRNTGISVDQREDPTTYHRQYYRRVRRYRMGRTPRVPE